ncbi:hypothetical protein ABRQ09_02980 [Pectobacterium brasiliense]|uniref:hypothetical protein n=1 Tax=Pectobacterium brasiliense TaxID=180957 RepID=UPI00069B4E12|nr:hypothetical protein [Pectobacterium brasiliense]MCG5048036.1 hypothetical protein [Pectobacterium brasiliense]
MNLITKASTPMSDYAAGAKGIIHSIAIEIVDIKSRVKDMHKIITDTSWLEPLNIINSTTYAARSEPTINKIVNDILSKVEDEISSDFGEYLISDTAQTALKEHMTHIRLPLAELIKEKISGNPGFDFHTECPKNFVIFGEAKYSGVANPHGKALSQINDFIIAKKDLQELSDIQHFVSAIAIDKVPTGGKSFCAAFSIISDDINGIMDNALNSEFMPALLCHEAIYLIGVKVSA